MIRFALFGGLIHGPTGHLFYRSLNRLIPGSTPTIVATKVLIDEIVWKPIFISLLFIFIGIVGGSTPNLIVNKLKSDAWIAVLGSWLIWPIAHALNFNMIPARSRLLYINTVQLIFNIFLSHVVGWPRSMF